MKVGSITRVAVRVTAISPPGPPGAEHARRLAGRPEHGLA